MAIRNRPPGLCSRCGVRVFLANPYPWSVVLNVASFVALNGFCYAGADSAIIGSNSVRVIVTTFLQPSLPLGDTVYPPFQSGQTVLAGEVSADEGGFLGSAKLIP
jgi:hypothetical protein